MSNQPTANKLMEDEQFSAEQLRVRRAPESSDEKVKGISREGDLTPTLQVHNIDSYNSNFGIS